MRVAAQQVSNSTYALLPDAPIQIASASSSHPALVFVLRQDVQFGVMVAICIVGTGLLLAPWRRKPVVGIAVRHGHVIGVIIALSVVTLPWPMALRPLGPALAQAQTLTSIVHFHVDHLGSIQVITDFGGTVNGTVYEYVRYR